MKQTAVEFLVNYLNDNYFFNRTLRQKIEQAKEMEKEQIMEACDYGIKLYINDPITSEDYYNETFNNNG